MLLLCFFSTICSEFLDLSMLFNHNGKRMRSHRGYYEGQLTSIVESDEEDNVEQPTLGAGEKVSLLEESIKPKADLPPLLLHLRERQPEKLHYMGVSFGLTLDLLRFWRKHKFAPFYIGQIPNAVTGEHTCMVLKPLRNDDFEVDPSDEWGHLGPFYRVFKQRFCGLLSSSFRSMEYKLAMSVLDPEINFEAAESTADRYLKSVNEYICPLDMKLLQSYIDNLSDFTLIKHLVPVLSHLYFQERIPVKLSYLQASILLCFGLQNQDISYIEGQMKLERIQILSFFIKSMKKFYKYLYGIASKEIESTLPPKKKFELKPHKITLDEDLEDAAKQVKDDMKAKAEELLDPKLIEEYSIGGDLETALQNGEGKISSSGLISVKSSKSKHETPSKAGSSKSEKKRNKDDRGSKSNKKRKS